MHEKSLESFEARGFKPRNVGIIVVLLMLCIMLWGTFVIVPAGSRGVVLWWGSVENRIMNEGLNFKVPMTETVIKVDVRVQPHPFREIDASSKEYQIVKMTGMMNFHIDPAFVNDLYQKVGLDFADKVIDPAFNDFVKEVVPTYPIGEILPKREEIRQTAMKKLGNNLSRYHIIVDDIYFANIRFSPEYEKAIEAKQVAQQQAKANEILAHSLTPILVSYKSIERWNGILPQVSGGAVPFIELGKMPGLPGTASLDKK